MEMISSRAAGSEFVPVMSQEKWAVELRNKFGNIRQLASKFNTSIERQRECHDEARKAMFSDMPSFVKVIKAYGQEAVEALIGIHIADLIKATGKLRGMDSTDVRNTAIGICNCIQGRTLLFSTVIGFFFAAKCGEYLFYGQNDTNQITSAFREYAIKQKSKQNRHYDEKQQYLAKLEWQEHKKKAVPCPWTEKDIEDNPHLGFMKNIIGK